MFNPTMWCGGQVVRVLAFYSNDQARNLPVIYSFSVKFAFEKNEKYNHTKLHIIEHLLLNFCHF